MKSISDQLEADSERLQALSERMVKMKDTMDEMEERLLYLVATSSPKEPKPKAKIFEFPVMNTRK